VGDDDLGAGNEQRKERDHRNPVGDTHRRGMTGSF
jgi:hypothetical protein